jgi:hypothetical protein
MCIYQQWYEVLHEVSNNFVYNFHESLLKILNFFNYYIKMIWYCIIDLFIFLANLQITSTCMNIRCPLDMDTNTNIATHTSM